MSDDTFTMPECDAPCWRPFVLAVTSCRAVVLRLESEPVLTATPLGAGRWELRQHPVCIPFEGDIVSLLWRVADFLTGAPTTLLAYARARGVEEPASPVRREAVA